MFENIHNHLLNLRKFDTHARLKSKIIDVVVATVVNSVVTVANVFD